MAIKKKVYEKSDGRCWYCGEVVKTDGHYAGGKNRVNPLFYTVDHVVPRSKGGGNNSGNLVLACFGCNASKNNLDLDEYRKRVAKRQINAPHFSEKQNQWLMRVYGINPREDIENAVAKAAKKIVFHGERQNSRR